MLQVSKNSQKIAIFTIKITVVLGAFYFIYNQLVNNAQLDWDKFQLIFNKNKTFSGIVFILFLSFLNRFLEILKWQNLIATFKKISLAQATKQVLAALTAGIFTPNGIGEYAGKALYYNKSQTGQIVFLNIICNGIQLLISVFFGVLGLFYLGFAKWVLGIIAILILVILLLFLLKKIKIKGYSINDFVLKTREISIKIHQKNMYLALARYLTFSHQYYFLLLAFDIKLPYFVLMSTIATVYFLASSLPNFQFLDFALKGSIGIYFYNLIGINNWIVIFVTTIMWFLNIVLPIVIGSFYVLTFKLKTEK